MERTRALECFLSERQEGEEKAIMKNLRLKEVSIKDLDQIRALYWRLLDSSPKYGHLPAVGIVGTEGKGNNLE